METNVVLTLDENKKSKIIKNMSNYGVQNTVIICDDFINTKLEKGVDLRRIISDFISNNKNIIINSGNLKSAISVIGYPYTYCLGVINNVFNSEFTNKIQSYKPNIDSGYLIGSMPTITNQRLVVPRNLIRDVDDDVIIFYEKFNNCSDLQMISRNGLVYNTKKHILLSGYSIVLKQQNNVRLTSVNIDIEKATDFKKLFTTLNR